ncbi:MAG: CRTAC1 family protein [Gemmataceae bacterium]|nr:CRTAC1 family protein [Gemmataceae bacterium]
MTTVRWLIIVAGVLLGVPGCGSRPAVEPDAGAPPWFEDITAKAGIQFVHDAGPVGAYFMPQQVGSGAALFDCDNDGLLDILLLQNGGPKSASTNQLYRQLRGGAFRDVSKDSGLDINGHNMGAAVGDVNHDGLLDVVITQYSGVKLFLNRGNCRFADVTDASGLSCPAWATSTAFLDVDRDGWLDLVVVCYVDYDPTWPCTAPSGKRDYCAPKTFKGRVSRLFRNQGQGGDSPRFEDVTVTSGLGQVPGPGLGVVCADLSGDGWPDIFIANDGEPNRLWINQRDGTFRDEAVERGIAYNDQVKAQAGMGIAVGDVDRDGQLDIFVTHLAEEMHTLWRQDPRGLFRDRTGPSGILKAHWRGTGFGTLFADFDNDGHLDLGIVNGAVAAQTKPSDDALGPFWRWYGQRNQLFAGDGAGRFRDISQANAPLCGHANIARGLVAGDIDRDGGIDLLVTAIAGPARLYRNVARRGHWLSVRAVDPAFKRDAFGAEIEVVAGNRRWLRLFHPAESYLTSSEPRAHFGLGDVATIDHIEVRWLDGSRETFAGGGPDRRLDLRKGAGLKRTKAS